MLPVFAERTNKTAQPSVKEGQYNGSEIVTGGKLAYLPIPIGREDYAFLQSIGKVTSIVIGYFMEGDRRIVWITDSNGDGTVDDGMIYYPENGKTSRIQNFSKEYTPEKFKKMKQDIISGKSQDLKLNPEGTLYLKKIVEAKSGLVKKVRYRNGFRTFVNDPDDPSTHRVMFYYSNNVKSGGGSDLVFEVFYHNQGTNMVSPVINCNVYCKDSYDPVVIEAVDDLSKFTSTYFGD
jgi:hypothetical protein